MATEYAINPGRTSYTLASFPKQVVQLLPPTEWGAQSPGVWEKWESYWRVLVVTVPNCKIFFLFLARNKKAQQTSPLGSFHPSVGLFCPFWEQNQTDSHSFIPSLLRAGTRENLTGIMTQMFPFQDHEIGNKFACDCSHFWRYMEQKIPKLIGKERKLDRNRSRTRWKALRWSMDDFFNCLTGKSFGNHSQVLFPSLFVAMFVWQWSLLKEVRSTRAKGTECSPSCIGIFGSPSSEEYVGPSFLIPFPNESHHTFSNLAGNFRHHDWVVNLSNYPTIPHPVTTTPPAVFIHSVL